MKRKKIFIYGAFPNEEKGFTGANIGNEVVADLLEDMHQVHRYDCGMKRISYMSGGARLRYRVLAMLHYLNVILFSLPKLLKGEGFDVFYFLPSSTMYGGLRDYLLLLVVRRYVNKVVGHVRNGDFHRLGERASSRLFLRDYLRRIDKFIFLSEGLSHACAEFIPEEKRVVIFNFIGKDMDCGGGHRMSSDANLNVLYVSNMIVSKGYFQLLRAASLICKARNDITFVFAGAWMNESDEREFLSFVADNQLEDYVRHLGKVTDRTYLKSLYVQADVFALPTFYPVEAQPRSIIEAMASGCAIVSSYHASIPEMILDGYEGVLLESSEPENLAEALVSLMDDRSRLKDFQLAAHSAYVSKFSRSAALSNLNNLF